MYCGGSAYSPVDATLYYSAIGSAGGPSATTAVITNTYQVLAAGVLRLLTAQYNVTGTLGTNESVVWELFKGGVATGIKITITYDSASIQFARDSTHTIAVAVDDIIDLRQAVVTWATNPTNVRIIMQFFITTS